MGRAVMHVDAPQHRLTGQFATGQVHHRERRRCPPRGPSPGTGTGRGGRDRPPGPRIGPDPGRHVVVQFRMQDRDIIVFPGPQPGHFPAQHATFLPDRRRHGESFPPQPPGQQRVAGQPEFSGHEPRGGRSATVTRTGCWRRGTHLQGDAAPQIGDEALPEHGQPGRVGSPGSWCPPGRPGSRPASGREPPRPGCTASRCC